MGGWLECEGGGRVRRRVGTRGGRGCGGGGGVGWEPGGAGAVGAPSLSLSLSLSPYSSSAVASILHISRLLIIYLRQGGP